MTGVEQTQVSMVTVYAGSFGFVAVSLPEGGQIVGVHGDPHGMIVMLIKHDTMAKWTMDRQFCAIDTGLIWPQALPGKAIDLMGTAVTTPTYIGAVHKYVVILEQRDMTSSERHRASDIDA